jgi:uncharacterized protein YuzE
MKVIFDRETDTLTVIFAETPIVESDEDKPGVILDHDESGNLVSLEILGASLWAEEFQDKIFRYLDLEKGAYIISRKPTNRINTPESLKSSQQ